MFLNSSEAFNCVGSIQSYSIAYAVLIISAFSRPGTVFIIWTWTSSGRDDDIPPTYISSVSSPSGSIKIWCLSLSWNLITLSSIDGQYLGPTPFILPLYIGDLCIFSWITLWVSSLVYVNQHETWSLSIFPLINENGIISSSPGCSIIFEKSTLLLLILAGVPVLNLLRSIPKSINDFESSLAFLSPFGPWPFLVRTPLTFPSSTSTETTSNCLKWRFSCVSKTFFILSWYFFLSACALRECTAGPFDVFNILDWINVWSIFTPISPPKASISLTRCPLAVPPILGLHGIIATESNVNVQTKVLHPILAAANPASQPAWPAPITTIS